MAGKMEVYKCDLCGNIVEVLHPAAGVLACCGQSMRLLEENSTDAAQEKHVPVVEKVENGFSVKVGSVAHPMDENHFIEFIELIAASTVFRHNLKPGDAPEVFFAIEAEQATARAYCNLHGLWRSK